MVRTAGADCAVGVVGDGGADRGLACDAIAAIRFLTGCFFAFVAGSAADASGAAVYDGATLPVGALAHPWEAMPMMSTRTTAPITVPAGMRKGFIFMFPPK